MKVGYLTHCSGGRPHHWLRTGGAEAGLGLSHLVTIPQCQERSPRRPGISRPWSAIAGHGHAWLALASDSRPWAWPAMAGHAHVWPALAGRNRPWPWLALENICFSSSPRWDTLCAQPSQQLTHAPLILLKRNSRKDCTVFPTILFSNLGRGYFLGPLSRQTSLASNGGSWRWPAVAGHSLPDTCPTRLSALLRRIITRKYDPHASPVLVKQMIDKDGSLGEESAPNTRRVQLAMACRCFRCCCCVCVIRSVRWFQCKKRMARNPPD